MIIKPNSKIALFGGEPFLNGLALEELRSLFAEAGRSDVEFFNCSEPGFSLNSSPESVLSLNPDTVIIVAAPSSPSLDNGAKLQFGLALEGLINAFEEKEITPLIATSPFLFSKETLSSAAEKALPFAGIAMRIAEKHSAYIIELSEGFMLRALEGESSGEPLFEGNTWSEKACRALGKIIAEECLF